MSEQEQRTIREVVEELFWHEAVDMSEVSGADVIDRFTKLIESKDEVIKRLEAEIGQLKEDRRSISDVRYAYKDEVARLRKELEDIRTYCTLTFGESHPQMKKCLHEAQLTAKDEEIKNLQLQLDKFSYAVTVIECKGCQKGYRNRDMSAGYCSSCLHGRLTASQEKLRKAIEALISINSIDKSGLEFECKNSGNFNQPHCATCGYYEALKIAKEALAEIGGL